MAAAPRVAAHRGGSLLWPENSLLAFEKAVALGSDLVEFDVHLTADGALAVIHDPTADRTTDGAGAVAAMTADQLRRLRLRGPDGAVTSERLPMLDEVLGVLGPAGVGLLVEVKGPSAGVDVAWERGDGGGRAVPGRRYEGLEETLLAALAAAGVLERSVIMAFNPDVVTRVRALAPRQRTTLLVARGHVLAAGARGVDTVAWARRFDATELGLQHTLVDEELVSAARAASVSLGVWTVNEEADLRRLVALGVDVVTSDRPDLALRVLGRAPEGVGPC